MRRLKRGVTTCLAVVFAVQATGCASWKAVSAPVPTAVAQHPNRKLQVVHRDGRTIKAEWATTDTATVYAYRTNAVDTIPRYVVDTIPVAEVREIKIRQFSPLKALLGTLLVLGAVFVAAGISFEAQGL